MGFYFSCIISSFYGEKAAKQMKADTGLFEHVDVANVL